jgi:hypothetical protein
VVEGRVSSFALHDEVQMSRFHGRRLTREYGVPYDPGGRGASPATRLEGERRNSMSGTREIFSSLAAIELQ